MAYADYRLCDKCEEKVFYDQQLDYRFHSKQDPIEKDERAKVCGQQDTNYRLQYLGDWAVLCEDCAKTHRTAILPLKAPEPSGETMAQREEVCAAWADLPPQLTAHPAMKRLYRALGGPAPRDGMLDTAGRVKAVEDGIRDARTPGVMVAPDLGKARALIERLDGYLNSPEQIALRDELIAALGVRVVAAPGTADAVLSEVLKWALAGHINDHGITVEAGKAIRAAALGVTDAQEFTPCSMCRTPGVCASEGCDSSAAGVGEVPRG